MSARSYLPHRWGTALFPLYLFCVVVSSAAQANEREQRAAHLARASHYFAPYRCLRLLASMASLAFAAGSMDLFLTGYEARQLRKHGGWMEDLDENRYWMIALSNQDEDYAYAFAELLLAEMERDPVKREKARAFGLSPEHGVTELAGWLGVPIRRTRKPDLLTRYVESGLSHLAGLGINVATIPGEELNSDRLLRCYHSHRRRQMSELSEGLYLGRSAQSLIQQRVTELQVAIDGEGETPGNYVSRILFRLSPEARSRRGLRTWLDRQGYAVLRPEIEDLRPALEMNIFRPDDPAVQFFIENELRGLLMSEIERRSGADKSITLGEVADQITREVNESAEYEAPLSHN